MGMMKGDDNTKVKDILCRCVDDGMTLELVRSHEATTPTILADVRSLKSMGEVGDWEVYLMYYERGHLCLIVS